MNRLLRYGLIFFMVMMFFITSIAIYLVVFFDPTPFKPLITQLIMEKSHRKLIFDGEIQVSLYPKLGIDLGRFSLSEYNAPEKVFATAERIHLSLSLLQLFSKQLQVDEILIQGLQAILIRFNDGRTNIDDLITHDEEAAQIEYAIDRVQIADTMLTFHDEMADKTFTLAGLNLETGPIALDTFNNLRLNTQIQVAGFEAFDKHNMDIKLNATQLHLSDGGVTSGTINLAVKMLNSDCNISSKASLSNIKTIGSRFKSKRVAIELVSKKEAQTIKANLLTSLVGDSDYQKLTLPDLTTTLSIIGTDLPNQHIHGNLTGSVSIDALAENILVSLVGKVESSSLKTVFAMDFTKPIFNFSVEIDQLDMDRFLPLSSKKAAPNKKLKNSQNLPKFDFSFLRSLHANGFIRIGVLQAGDIQSSDIQFEVQSDNHALNLDAAP